MPNNRDMSSVIVIDHEISNYESDEDLFSSMEDDDMPALDSGTDESDDIFGDPFGNPEICKETDQPYLVTGVGPRDYSLLQEVNVGGHDGETIEQVDMTPDISAFKQEGLASGPSNNAPIDTRVRETSTWMSPTDLLAAVETKLSEEGPRLAEYGTLGTGTMLGSGWSKPVVPFVVGTLTDPVPYSDDRWTKHDLVCSGHKGQNTLIKQAKKCMLVLKPVYKISEPQIHASTLMAMVIACRLKTASTCHPSESCNIPHHVEDVLVSTSHVYRDIMEAINGMRAWPYVQRFVNAESFTYTTQVFVRGVYSRQVQALSRRSIHQDITLVYPKTTLPSEGIILSTAMRECFEQATRGLVQINKFSLVIECHGPKPSRYFKYKLDPLHERMGIVCICAPEKVDPPCYCAQLYVQTLTKSSGSHMANPHTLASLHARSLPESISIIAYNMFALIDELTRGPGNSVKRDTTMRGNNVSLEVGSFTHKAAYLYYKTRYSFSNQPSLFIEIHISLVLLATAQDVLNSVAQMCATVLFIMKFGHPDRTEVYDQKYNDIVKHIAAFFPTLAIQTLSPVGQQDELPSYSKPLACDDCGATRAFVKRAYTSVLVCGEKCRTDTLRKKQCQKLKKSNNSGPRFGRAVPYC